MSIQAVQLIDQIIDDNKSMIKEFDTIQGFFNSLKNALCDGEYLATLNTDQDTVNQAYELLENLEKHQDVMMDMVLKDLENN